MEEKEKVCDAQNELKSRETLSNRINIKGINFLWNQWNQTWFQYWSSGIELGKHQAVRADTPCSWRSWRKGKSRSFWKAITCKKGTRNKNTSKEYL